MKINSNTLCILKVNYDRENKNDLALIILTILEIIKNALKQLISSRNISTVLSDEQSLSSDFLAVEWH